MELGDIVTFARNERVLTGVAFNYFVSSGNGNEAAMVYFRDVIEVDGILMPYNLLLGINHALPDTVAWTVSFSGFEVAEEGELLFYDAPTVGSSPTQNGAATMTQYVGGGYEYVDTAGVIDNLSAQFIAVPEIPAASLASGAALLALASARRVFRKASCRT